MNTRDVVLAMLKEIYAGNEFSQFESVDIIGVVDHLVLKPIVKDKNKNL